MNNAETLMVHGLQDRIRELEAERDSALARLEALLKALADRRFAQFLLGLAIKLGVPIDSEDEESLLMDQIAPAVDHLVKRAEAAEEQIELAGGYHARTQREIELAEQLEEVPENNRDPADVAIGELLALVDAGRNRAHLEMEAKEAAIKRAEAAEKGLVVECPPQWEVEKSTLLHALRDRDAQIAALREMLTEYGYRADMTMAEWDKVNAALASDHGKPLLAWIERAAKAMEEHNEAPTMGKHCNVFREILRDEP